MLQRRLRVLVLAYMISPIRGSEYAVAWNYVQVMRAHCDLTILYGAAGPHMGDVHDFEAPNFIDQHESGNVTFRFVPEPLMAKRLNALNRRGIFTYSFYLAYREWHRAALLEAEQLIASGQFDLVHYLGPIGYREPGYLWKLPLPYVWGPIGGATSFPWRFRAAMPLGGRLRLFARMVGNALQLHLGRRIGKALRRSDALLTATTENQKVFHQVKGVRSIYLPENGIEGPISLNDSKFPADVIRIAWIGTLEARKGLELLLRAVAGLRDASRLQIDILGDGPLWGQLRQLASDLKISPHIIWHGRVPRSRVLEILDCAHLHVITGLNEANTTSIWEALAYSVPVVALDHCGMHDVVQPPYGIRIPIDTIDTAIDGITEALETLIAAPVLLETMARSCVDECDKFRIVHRPAVLLGAYRVAHQKFHEQRSTH